MFQHGACLPATTLVTMTIRVSPLGAVSKEAFENMLYFINCLDRDVFTAMEEDRTDENIPVGLSILGSLSHALQLSSCGSLC